MFLCILLIMISPHIWGDIIMRRGIPKGLCPFGRGVRGDGVPLK